MTGRITDITPRRAAIIAGAGYLVIFVLALFANFFVRTNLVETGDAVATAANIADNEGLFRAGLVAFLIVFVVDVVIAWALYILFRTVSRDWSLVTAWFRLVYTVFLGVAVIFFFVALRLLSGAGYLDVLGSGQLEAHALLSLEAFNYTWLVGLVAFGLHLILLGYLILRTGSIPRWLGIVLMVAGSAYILDTVANGVLANYEDYENVFLAIVAVPSVVGELAFTVWLLARGGRQELAAA